MNLVAFLFMVSVGQVGTLVFDNQVGANIRFISCKPCLVTMKTHKQWVFVHSIDVYRVQDYSLHPLTRHISCLCHTQAL